MREPAAADKETAVDRLLLLVSDVRAGEGHTALLMMTNLFLLLTGYLIIKTVREALILSEGGAVVKSYAAAGQALLLLAFMPVYSYVGSRVGRIKLVNGVTIFFIFNLLVFYLLARLQVALGVPFFLWVGIFNLFAVAQFWSSPTIFTPKSRENDSSPSSRAGAPLVLSWVRKLLVHCLSPSEPTA